jgi:lactoylglutathione lyase
MRTLHVGLRVADLAAATGFYTSIGYEVLGDMPGTELGTLTMLKLPGDEFVGLCCVDASQRGGEGDSMKRTRRPRPPVRMPS